ncbi:MAG: hypothetical protein DI548_02220 [Flavobacterium johnsoniae]|nr:MAG: hypothetical protein DI548_02220 [Flavobacterium johnsoniae]
MDFKELERQINTSIIISGLKFNALRSVLSDEQLEKYREYISKEKIRMQSALAEILTKEQLDEALAALDD